VKMRDMYMRTGPPSSIGGIAPQFVSVERKQKR
jgi:hypothetical protein